MRKKIYISIAILVVGFLGFFIYGVLTTRSHSPSETKAFSHAGLDVKVVYSRPYKKGRLIFGDEKDEALVPNGKYWRIGANDATEITFSKPVNFAGKPVSAGSYRMYAVPNATSWEITLNSELGKFGYFEPNYALDVVKVNALVEPSPVEVEQLTINFDNDSTGVIMDILWDKTIVRIPIAAR